MAKQRAGRRAAQMAFVMQYLADRSLGHDNEGHYHSASIETTVSFDDGMDFAVAFRERFPGRVRDPNHRLASQQLYRLMTEMTNANLLERGRLGNEGDGLSGSPKWQYVYSLPQWLVDNLKQNKDTARNIARRHFGLWESDDAPVL